MESTKNSRLGQGAVFLCAVFWSTGGLFIKLIDWHPVVIAGMRSFLAALFLLAWRFLDREKRERKFEIRPLLPAALVYALTMILFVLANKLTASANVILLQYSAPIWAAILGWIVLREKLYWENWTALVLVMAGLILFFKDGLASGSFLGDSLALLSGITFGAYPVFMRTLKDGDPADAVILANIFAALFSVPFLAMNPPEPAPLSVMAILFLGLIQIGLASVFYSYGIKRIRAIQAMLSSMIEPVLNPVWVLLVTGEKPALPALIGGSIIIAAVVISSIAGKSRLSGESAPGESA